MVKQKPGPKFRNKKVPMKELSVYDCGLDAFRRGDYGEAIKLWQNLPSEDPQKNIALAEAYFRHALIDKEPQSTIANLETARKLDPQDSRYPYHLGLAFHRLGNFAEADAAYADAARLGFSPRRLIPARGLLKVERNPFENLQTFDWLSEQEREKLRPIAYLLQGNPQHLLDSENQGKLTAPPNPAVLDLWKGLAQISVGRIDDAIVTLAPPRQPLPSTADAVRVCAYSLALIARGRDKEAAPIMENTLRRTPLPALVNIYSELVAQQFHERLESGRFDEVEELLQRAHQLIPGSRELTSYQLIILNRQANATAERGEYQYAILSWQQMHALLLEFPELGPIGTITHNMAIAAEALERWEYAAERWNEIIGLLPRRQTQKPSKHFAPTSRLAVMPVQEAKDWLRKRIILCYQKAGQPEQAIDIYKKAVKQDPEDLQLRMGLVDALVANDQWQAARNELKRIIGQDSKFIPARVTLAHLLREDGYEIDAEAELHTALELDPNAESARQEMASLLTERGKGLIHWSPQNALTYLMEALQYEPEDIEVMALIGQMNIILKQSQEGQTWFERVLAKNTLDAYGHVFTAYLNLDDIRGARELIDRFRGTSLEHKVDFYLIAAKLSIGRTPPDISYLFSMNTKTPKNVPEDNDWRAFGIEMIDQALAAETGPAQKKFLEMVISELTDTQPEIVIPYAQKLVDITPEDPETLAKLGTLQTLAEQNDAAKATLLRAEKLAQKQHNRLLVEHIRVLRAEIGNPLIKMFRSLGPLRERLGDIEDEDFEDMIDNILFNEMGDDKEFPFK